MAFTPTVTKEYLESNGAEASSRLPKKNLLKLIPERFNDYNETIIAPKFLLLFPVFAAPRSTNGAECRHPQNYVFQSPACPVR